MQVKFQDQKPVLFSEASVGAFALGVIQLNRPQALNSLNTEAYTLIEAKLLAWAKDNKIAAVIIEASGDKAFCAGGDVKALALNNLDSIKEFFTKEYFVDCLIHKYPKPVIALADGITMGGGVGLINGASHRVLTEKTIMAMPEVAIGLFPDVGATHFLNSCPDDFGLFMGLTGARISAGDAVRAGLADYVIPSKIIRNVFADLIRLPWSEDSRQNKKNLTEYFKVLAPEAPEPTNYNEYMKWRSSIEITHYFDFYEKLFKADFAPGFMQTCKERFIQGSPTSKQVFFEAYKKHKHLDIRETLIAEWGMALQFCSEHEFYEGVRAVLIDKDNAPQWMPAGEYEVSEVARFFNFKDENLLAQKLAKLSGEFGFLNS